MAENCSHDCANCSANCSGRSAQPAKIKPHLLSRIKHVIGVVSGKGGVGKSFVTGLLGTEMTRRGFSCGILDGDITGPSIPKMFGVHGRAQADQDGIYPVTSANGVQIMSLNLLLENETDPVIWRGALITGTVQQFWTDVIWRDIDYLFIDMPPGTGDVTLTVFQSLPLDGIIMVSSPQAHFTRQLLRFTKAVCHSLSMSLVSRTQSMSPAFSAFFENDLMNFSLMNFGYNFHNFTTFACT